VSNLQITVAVAAGLLIGGLLVLFLGILMVKWFLRYLAQRTVSGLLQVGERQIGRVVGVGEKHLDRALEAGGKEIAKGVAAVAADVRKNDPKRLEVEATRLAESRQGVLTVAEVMSGLELPQFKAQQVLAGLVRSKVCKIDSGPLGTRYLFEAFQARVEEFRCPFCEKTFSVCPDNRICDSCGGAIRSQVVPANS